MAVVGLPPAGAAVVRLNELLANAPAGWLELANAEAEPVDLAGWSIRVPSTTPPQAWTFGPDSVIGPGDFQFITSDSMRLTFPSAGGRIELRDQAGALVDALDYGFQLPAESIGRIGDRWVLQAQPSPGSANGIAAALAEVGQARINEWKFNDALSAGWIELHNPASLPVDLAGCQLTITGDAAAALVHSFPAAGFIAPFHWLVIAADPQAPDVVPNTRWSLKVEATPLRLLSATGLVLDEVTLNVAPAGQSAGRLPDGGSFLAVLSKVTPGAANQSDSDSDGDGLPDGWEARFGLNPGSAGDAALDPDGDGLSNLGEFQAGRNPRVADPPLAVKTHVDPDGSFHLRFEAAAGQSYSVLVGETPAQVTHLFVPFIADGAPRTVTVTDRMSELRFYQIVSPARATSPPPFPAPKISPR